MFLPQALLALTCALFLAASPVPAQLGGERDTTINNLVLPEDYVTSAPGTLGNYLEHGKGPIDMVLVSGFGLGSSAFEPFMNRNENRYHMIAVTLAGFEGSPSPPMPPAGTSYGAQTWTRGGVDAVLKIIRDKHLNRPVVVGHFINGTQVATRLAIEHPDQVRALVLLAGTPRFEPVTASRLWPKNLTLQQKVKAVDEFSAPRWFKTVTADTWVKGNFVASDYSVDPARGKLFATRANAAPLPVLVRWLCEFHASDLWPDLKRVQQPLLVLQPSFTKELRADTTRSYLQGYFAEPWKGRLEGRAKTETSFIDNAGILLMDDQAALVDQKIEDFLERYRQ